MTRRHHQSAPAQHSQAFVQVFSEALQLHQAGDLDGAIGAYRRALALNPRDPVSHTNLGVALYAKGQIDEAVPLHKKSIALDATSSISFNNLGVALNALTRYSEAVDAFAKAVVLDPNNARAFSNLGDALTNAGRYEESIVQLYKALDLQPDFPDALTNMGMAYWGVGKLEQAVGWFRVALALNPKLAMARKNLGIVQLLRGQYAEGWQEYDWRWVADGIPLRPFTYKLWTGENLGTRELLIWAEQGPGDEILQASMMEDLVRHGFRVVWEADPRLVGLFQRSQPAVRVVPRQNPPLPMGGDVAAHLPAASLGHFFRNEASKFPRHRAGYLVADTERAAKLRADLGIAPGEKLVGISWVSKNRTFGEKKSTTLRQWADLLRTPKVRFVDLQYGDTAAERAGFKAETGLDLIHVEGLDLRDDIDGLAALISCCDLVITVSNTTAHVAGALGVPVWILVAAGGGKLWYWGTDKETPDWYPRASIIRQKSGEAWTVPLTTAATRLRKLVG